MTQFQHQLFTVTFDNNNYHISEPQSAALDIITDLQEGKKFADNNWFIGRTGAVFYSIKLVRVDNLDQNSVSDINHSVPYHLLSRYFFQQQIICGVIGCKAGSDRFSQEVQQQALTAGKTIAKYGFVTLTGGLSGVMEKASEGAKQAGGVTLGILPGSEKKQANDFVDHVIPSGIGYARNYVLAQTADILIALNGGRGTLEEICFGLDFDKQVLSLNSWDIPEVTVINVISDIDEHLDKIFKSALLSSLEGKYQAS